MKKYQVDFARGIAYKGKNGFHILLSKSGLYVQDAGKEVYLTSLNTKVIEESYTYGR